jgi:hypothetical protein
MSGLHMDDTGLIDICVLLSERINYLESRIAHLEDARAVPEYAARLVPKVSYY